MLFLSIVDDKSNTNILNFNLLEVSNHTKATFFQKKEQIKANFVIFAPCFKHLLRKKDY